VKEYHVQPTRADIATQVASDRRPSGPDGAANCDRTAFIFEVFECDALDLDAHYDFLNITTCKDLDQVEACKHIALLKMQYTKELADYGLIQPIDADVTLNFLTLTVQRINWHLQHLGMGRRTPPFPGLN
jgi:hypothetical protein